MLLDIETRCIMVEKMVLVLVTAKKKISHYIELHTIVVVTNYPIKQVLSKLDLLGRLINWAIQMGVYDIRYTPKTSMKGQAVVDFLVEI